MYTPFVSIIVPNYNHAGYLPLRMDSILSQTYDNYEVIILDDASTDNSIEVISEYANNPHVSHVVRNGTNSGSPFRQWNRGIELAQGEIIWIAESDDYCAPTMLKRMVEAYVQYHCTLVFSRSVAVDEEGNQMYICQRMFRQDKHLNGARFIKRYMNTGNRIYNASSAIFSKKVALNISHEFESYMESGDWVFWIEIARQGNVAVIAEPLNYFRRSSTTQTSKSTLSGAADLEDFKVMAYLQAQALDSPYHLFLKKKRMAVKMLYAKDRYQTSAIRQEVIRQSHFPAYYFLLARLSHLFHSIRRNMHT